MTLLCSSLPLSFLGALCVCRSFCSSHSHSPIFFFFFSLPARIQHRGRRRRKDGRKCRRKKGIGKKRNRSEGETHEWQEGRRRDNLRRRPISVSYKCLNFKGGCADVGISTRCTPIPIPPLLSSLLANHHTTLLYLGHCNVLLPSPMADALCRNLRKIGWEEERSGGEREKRRASDRSGGELSPLRKLKLLFCDFPPNRAYLLLSLFSSPPHSVFICLSVNCEDVPQLLLELPYAVFFFLFLFFPPHNLICAVPKPFTKPLPKPQR